MRYWSFLSYPESNKARKLSKLRLFWKHLLANTAPSNESRNEVGQVEERYWLYGPSRKSLLSGQRRKHKQKILILHKTTLLIPLEGKLRRFVLRGSRSKENNINLHSKNTTRGELIDSKARGPGPDNNSISRADLSLYSLPEVKTKRDDRGK